MTVGYKPCGHVAFGICPLPQVRQALRYVQVRGRNVCPVTRRFQKAQGFLANLRCGAVMPARRLGNREVDETDSLVALVTPLSVQLRGLYQRAAEGSETSAAARRPQ